MSLKKLIVMLIAEAVVYCASNKKQAMLQLEHILGDKMCPHNKVEFEAISRSVLDCARLCTTHSCCITIIFLHGNNTCFGINEYSPFSEYIPMPGARFYRPRLNESIPLIAPLPDAQFSASSDYNINHAAHRARLNDTNCWGPVTLSAQEFLQVDFLAARVVTSIITRGCGNYNGWSKAYKVSTSCDCTTFMDIVNVNGSEKIIDGNVDRSSYVENTMVPPVVARCLRIQAVDWKNHITFRIEAMGKFV